MLMRLRCRTSDGFVRYDVASELEREELLSRFDVGIAKRLDSLQRFHLQHGRVLLKAERLECSTVALVNIGLYVSIP
jgi:hypothetical protein